MATESKAAVALSGTMAPTTCTLSAVPAVTAERAILEKKLVRKLDMRLMPVLFVMIILK